MMGVTKMVILKAMLLSTLVISLVACSEHDSGASSGAANVETEKPSGVIPAHQLKAMERAKEVEGLLQKSEQDLRAKIDADS